MWKLPFYANEPGDGLLCVSKFNTASFPCQSHKPSSIACKVLLQNFKKYIKISIESIPTHELAVFFCITIIIIIAVIVEIGIF